MPLAPGEKLGAYEVLSLLGKGGMGEVYRARDLQLKREVALKVLPAVFSSDPDRLARFQREAELLASLDHPNIGHIYGIVQAERNWALVLALIEGPTLADRLKQGAIPPPEAIAIAKQIIDAMEYAHDNGVIHRDLKPANIKITPDGLVKVLDFGLAKALDQRTAASLDPENSPTLTMGATQAGVIMGTAAYMSPEQAVGKPADRRSDVFSFGAVLFEMLTGQRPFQGDSMGDTLAAVVKDTPDWSRLPAETPSHVRKLLERALAKDRKQRLQAIGEARIALDRGEETPAPVAAPTSKSNKPAWAVAGVLAAGLTVALWAPWRSQPVLDKPMLRFDVDLGADVSLAPAGSRDSGVVLSPDGTRMAFLSGTPPRIHLRQLDTEKTLPLVGTENAANLNFSPDGKWIGFLLAGKLRKLPVEGGAVVPLFETIDSVLAQASQFSWSEDGNLIVTSNTGLLRVRADGSKPEVLVEKANGELSTLEASLLPGGKALLFGVIHGADAKQGTTEVLTLPGRVRKVLLNGVSKARYLPSGHLLYNRGSVLFAVPFDLDKLEIQGTAAPVLDGVMTFLSLDWGVYATSNTGLLTYRGSTTISGTPEQRIDWLDSSGKQTTLIATPGNYLDLTLSRDGKRVMVVSEVAGKRELGIYDVDRALLSRLVTDGVVNSGDWSPDGTFIAYIDPAKGIFTSRVDGASPPQLVIPAQGISHVTISPDGKWLGYTATSPKPGLWTAHLEVKDGQWRAGKPELFLEAANPRGPWFSPDGRWVSYSSSEVGKPPEVYVQPFPRRTDGQGGKWQVSNGGSFGLWRGKDLFYLGPSQQFMAVAYSTKGDAFVPEKPRPVFTRQRGAFDISADGKRLATIVPNVTKEVTAEKAPTAEHVVKFVLNLDSELRRKFPK